MPAFLEAVQRKSEALGLENTGLVEPTGIIVDAKTGVSGAGRGGGSTFGYAEVNEDVAAYNLTTLTHRIVLLAGIAVSPALLSVLAADTFTK